MGLNYIFLSWFFVFVVDALYNNFHVHIPHNRMVKFNDVIIIFLMWLVSYDLMNIFLLIYGVNIFSHILIWLTELPLLCLKKNVHMKCIIRLQFCLNHLISFLLAHENVFLSTVPQTKQVERCLLWIQSIILSKVIFNFLKIHFHLHYLL